MAGTLFFLFLKTCLPVDSNLLIVLAPLFFVLFFSDRYYFLSVLFVRLLLVDGVLPLPSDCLDVILGHRRDGGFLRCILRSLRRMKNARICPLACHHALLIDVSIFREPLS